MFTCCLPLCASSANAVPFSWDANAQGGFLTCLCRDARGGVWVGTEGSGVSRYDPAAPKGKRWTQFTGPDGPGADVYALACDKQGRVWAGTARDGVAVYNGRAWRTYDRLTGPLGAHVTALAVSPRDGGIWMGSEAGLARYEGGRWTYRTRADGLPANGITSLAFAPDGTLYAGTLCDGIALASPRDGYRAWRVVPGPAQSPPAPVGKGLPSDQINVLYVSPDGTAWAGTNAGLARSGDGGRTWAFRRGADWADKLAGLAHPVPPTSTATRGDLLREDYVTCLAGDGAGRLWIGHRAAGVEGLDLKTGLHVLPPANVGAGDFVSALLPGPAPWIARYGGGLVASQEGAAPKTVVALPAPDFPAPAAPPTLAELAAMRARVERLTTPIPVGGGAYEGEDWATQGDWVGRYGSRRAILGGNAAPLDHEVLSDPSYEISGRVGPHANGGEHLRHWAYWVRSDDPRVLWDPLVGYRREGEWDDHGETYPATFDGPNVWVEVTVPAGLHHLSLYLMNVNGHDLAGENGRDYRIELKSDPADAADPDALPTLATARAHQFWGGVYERFLVRGPGRFAVKVGRNYSKNAILQAVLLDKISGPPTPDETRRALWYGGDAYRPPPASKQRPLTPAAVAAQRLWDALEQHSDRQGEASLLLTDRLLAYRAWPTSEKPADWRWQLALWDPAERVSFQKAMAANWQGLVAVNPKLALGNQ